MVKCNTREYAAICVDMEGISTSKKEKKRATLETQHGFSTVNATRMMMDCRRNFLRISAYGNLDRNRLWSLNLLCLVETPITIFEQYFRFDANLRINFPFFRNGKRDLLLLDITA